MILDSGRLIFFGPPCICDLFQRAFVSVRHNWRRSFSYRVSTCVRSRCRFGADAFLLRDVITATTFCVNTEHEYSQLERVFSDSPASGAARKTAVNALALVRYFSFHFILL